MLLVCQSGEHQSWCFVAFLFSVFQETADMGGTLERDVLDVDDMAIAF